MPLTENVSSPRALTWFSPNLTKWGEIDCPIVCADSKCFILPCGFSTNFVTTFICMALLCNDLINEKAFGLSEMVEKREWNVHERSACVSFNNRTWVDPRPREYYRSPNYYGIYFALEKKLYLQWYLLQQFYCGCWSSLYTGPLLKHSNDFESSPEKRLRPYGLSVKFLYWKIQL